MGVSDVTSLQLATRSKRQFRFPLKFAKRHYWVVLDGQTVVATGHQTFDTSDAAVADWASRKDAIDTFVSAVGDSNDAIQKLKDAADLIQKNQGPEDTYADEVRDVLRRFAGSQLT